MATRKRATIKSKSPSKMKSLRPGKKSADQIRGGAKKSVEGGTIKG